MGPKYLMDSNVIIDYLGNKLPAKSNAIIDILPIVISVITRMEIVGLYNGSQQQIKKLVSFCDKAMIYSITEEIILQTINIRQKYKIKLPDAIIAATAIANRLTLITHDINDYAPIKPLKIIDSWAM